MPEREKVINGLECRSSEEDKCLVCPYYGVCYVTQKFPFWAIFADAIALLKAQEPVEPTLDIRHGKSMWRCGSCSTALQPNNMHAKFCFNCGRAVKWE